MKPATTFFVALALLSNTAHGAIQRARYLMGTVCEVAVGGPEAEREIEAAFAEAKRIESMLSTWTDQSELAQVNAGTRRPSAELGALLSHALDWSARTNGAFDPRMGDLISLWRTREEGTLPDPRALRAALPSVQPHPRIEEGAFGKGYALDRMLALLSGEALIDFGGQIHVRGEASVRIADPRDRQRAVAAFTLHDASVSTSSGSEKTFDIAGRQFSHIIDPRTGEALPPRGSVSVIAASAMAADILSTALYVMGEDDGLRWADVHGVAAIFINPFNQVRRSAAAREQLRDLTLIDPAFTIKD